MGRDDTYYSWYDGEVTAEDTLFKVLKYFLFALLAFFTVLILSTLKFAIIITAILIATLLITNTATFLVKRYLGEK